MKRLLFAPLLLAGFVASAAAQDFSTTTVFTFAPAPGPDVVADPNTELKATPRRRQMMPWPLAKSTATASSARFSRR